MHHGAFPHDLRFKHQVVDEPKAAREDSAHRVRRLLAGHVGQESEPSEVHAEHRHLVVSHPAGGPQNRTVAAQHDHHVSVGGPGRGSLPVPVIHGREQLRGLVSGRLHDRGERLGLAGHVLQPARAHDRKPHRRGRRLTGAKPGDA